MEKLLYVAEDRKNEIVAKAIGQETPCVVTRREGEGWSTYKTRFLPDSSAVGRVYVELPNGEDASNRPRFSQGEQVGITFRRGHKKSMFSTVVLSGAVEAAMEDGGTASCIEIRWPEALQEVQRRAYFRAVPKGKKVHVRFWRGGVAARSQAGTADNPVLDGVLFDLSAGGMRVTVKDVAEDFFTVGESVGCSFTPKMRGETLVLDVTYRHYQADEKGDISLGFQFVGLETSERGRNTLAKLASVVSDYHRAAARKKSPPGRQH